MTHKVGRVKGKNSKTKIKRQSGPRGFVGQGMGFVLASTFAIYGTSYFVYFQTVLHVLLILNIIYCMFSFSMYSVETCRSGWLGLSSAYCERSNHRAGDDHTQWTP